jgi:hypothetical protein
MPNYAELYSLFITFWVFESLHPFLQSDVPVVEQLTKVRSSAFVSAEQWMELHGSTA